MKLSPLFSETPTTDESCYRRAYPVLLVLLTLLGGAIRFSQARESLWVDELHTAWTVAGGLHDIPPRAARGNYSPLYFYLPWVAARLLGSGEIALRLPSLLAGIALIPLTCLAIARWTKSSSAGLLAGFLVTIDQNFLFFSLEARSYALVQLTALGHLMLFWRLLKKPTRLARLGFVAGAAALFYLHYTTVLLIIAELAYYAALHIWQRRAIAYRWWALAADFAIAALCCLPAMGHVLEIAARRQQWALFIKPPPADAMIWVHNLPAYVILPGCLVIVLMLVCWLARRKPVVNKIRWELVCWTGCWLAVPVGIAWLATCFGTAPIFHRRYIIASALAPIVMTSLLYLVLANRMARATYAFLLVLAMPWVPNSPLRQWLQDGRLVQHSQEDWRGAVRHINQARDTRHLPVLLHSGLIEADALDADSFPSDPALWEYCLLPVTSIYRLDQQDRQLVPLRTTHPGRLSDRQLQLLVQQGGAWLVVRGRMNEASMLEDMFAGLQSRGATGRIVSHDYFQQVSVLRIQVVSIINQ